jgi:hypothetical protein
MTKQEQIDLIAEKVTGWKKDNYCVGVDVYKRPGISSLSVSEYNPFTNISQAIEALDKYREKTGRCFCIVQYQYEYNVCNRKHMPAWNGIDISVFHKELSEAISLALIEAIGERKWK